MTDAHKYNFLLCITGGMDPIERMFLTVISKVTSIISLIGSTYIIYDVLHNNPIKRKESSYHRIMLGVSISDIILSLGIVLYPSFPTTTSNCTIIGFFFTTTVTIATLYLCSLSTYYLLQLKFNMADLKVRASEKWLHLSPWVIGLTTAGVGIATDVVPMLMNLVSFFYITITMFLVYKYVHKIEMDALKFSLLSYRGSTLTNTKRSYTKRSRRIIIQGAFYCGTLILTCTFPSLNVFLGDEEHLILRVLQAIFLPLHGFYNCLIYLYPTFQKMWQNYEKKLEERMTMGGACCCCERIESFFHRNDRNDTDAILAHTQSSERTDNYIISPINAHKTTSLATGIMIGGENDKDNPSEFLLVGGSLSKLVSNHERSKSQRDIVDPLTQIDMKRQSLVGIYGSPISKSLSDLDQYMDLEYGKSLKKVQFTDITPVTFTAAEKKKKLKFESEDGTSSLPDVEQGQTLSILALDQPTDTMVKEEGGEKEGGDNGERRKWPMRYLERQESIRNLAQLLDSMQKAGLETKISDNNVTE